MAFYIQYQPLNPILGVGPRTVSKQTAAEAWAEIQMLEASDERVEVRDAGGRIIDKAELRVLAEQEQN
jgi:hypothetical protein